MDWRDEDRSDDQSAEMRSIVLFLIYTMAVLLLAIIGVLLLVTA